MVFSAVAGYLIAAYPFDLLEFFYLVAGGFLVVASSNAFNQIWERDRDALMQRTKNRPLPSGRLSFTEAFVAASVYGLIGAFLLFLINPKGFLVLIYEAEAPLPSSEKLIDSLC